MTKLIAALLAAVLLQDAGPAPWFDPEYDPPTTLTTDRVLLEPLSADHVELDFAALMNSREHLQNTLRWGDWPSEDFTIEENEADLERHGKEFEDREGYAFTVLAPDRSRCLGCVYINPLDKDDKQSRDAMMAYWVIEEGLESDLDTHLLGEVLAWIERDWLFERVVLMLHEDNARGIAVAEELELTRFPGKRGEHVTYGWKR